MRRRDLLQISAAAAGQALLPGVAAAAATRRPSGRPRTPPAPRAWTDALANHRFGVALAGLEFGEDVFPGRFDAEIAHPPEDRYAYYASRGIRSVRLPYLWERFQPVLFGELDGGVDLLAKDRRTRSGLRYKDVVRAQLDLANRYGIKVLLDPHNYAARALWRDGRWVLTGGTGRRGRYAIGSREVPIAAFADFVGKLVAEFGTHPAVLGFDIMNEPVMMPGGSDTWFAAAQAAIDAARRVNRDVLLFIEGYQYANAHTWDRNNPRLHQLVDPSNALVFSAHLYFDGDHSGRYEGPEAFAPRPRARVEQGADDIRVFLDWLQRHDLRGHVGEFGAPDTPGWRPVVERFLDECRRRQVLMHAWADWPRPSRYVLQLNPQGGPDKQIVRMLAELSRGR